MNKFRLPHIIVLLGYMFVSQMVFAQNVEIKTGDVELKVGESVALEAEFTNSAGEKVDTTITWSVTPAYLGVISGSEFIAEKTGNGKITAQVGKHKDSIKVKIVSENDGDGDDGKPGKGSDYPAIKISPDKLKLSIGETVELSVVYIKENGEKVDTTATWSVTPDSLASIDAAGLLTALKNGKGTVIAELDSLTDSVELEIEDDDNNSGDHPGKGGEFPNIKVNPEKIKLMLGDSLQLTASYYFSSGVYVDTTVTWIVEPDSLASINPDGFLKTLATGEGTITAQIDSLTDTVELEIEEMEQEDDDEDNDPQKSYPYIKLSPDSLELDLGQTKKLKVVYVAGPGNKVDTTAIWNVEPASLASIDSDGIITALALGEGVVTATVDTLTASLRLWVVINDEEDDDDPNKSYPYIQLAPDSLELDLGQTKKLKVVYVAGPGSRTDTTAAWNVNPASLASVDSNGLLTALELGEGIVTATVDTLVDSLRLKVVAKENDDDEENDYPKIKFVNKKLDMEIGDTAVLQAKYYDATGTVQDVDFSWLITPGYLGSIADNIFTAEHAGFGHIIAQYDTIQARLRVKIESDGEGHKDDPEGEPVVKILTRKVNIAQSDSVQLVAVYLDSSGTPVDTTIDWSVIPATMGHFTTNGLFHADEVGLGLVIAAVGQVKDEIQIKVREPDEAEQTSQMGQLYVIPGDTTVEVGASVQFYAQWCYQGVYSDTTVDAWFISDSSLGSINSSGLFTAAAFGVGFVKAKLGDHEATAQIAVNEPVADAHIVEFSRVLPNGGVLPPEIIAEGEAYVLGGLPSPLDVLNGGTISFPPGSLVEDISIHMLLPESVEVSDSTVSFADSSVAAVQFMVMVADSVIEPYYFGVPLNIAIPYNQDLLDSLGITAQDIGLFFADASGDYLDDGLTNITIDSVANKIYAQVEHFSTLVVRSKVNKITNSDNGEQQLPETFKLEQNYPNPFNPVTEIKFAVPHTGQVRVDIYNALGQKVETLVNKNFKAGTYQAMWNAQDQATGVYLYTLFFENRPLQTKKMILIK